MNTFKRKSLHAAVLAGLAAVGFAGTASPRPVSSDSGNMLVYPYYTVRADGGGNSTAYYDTLISVVNHATSHKSVKVKFLEGKRSAEVLDFNLFLSPNDVWQGVARGPAGNDENYVKNGVGAEPPPEPILGDLSNDVLVAKIDNVDVEPSVKQTGGF